MNEVIKEGKNLLFIQGKKEDLDWIVDLEKEDENKEFIIPWDKEFHTNWLNNPASTHLIILEKSTNEKVGYLMINGLTSHHKEIEWTRILITKKGKGYGKETLEMLKSWAFDDLKFHRAWLDCKDYNTRALHVYENAGLIREGLIRETILNNGKYENLVILGILDREYHEKNNP